VIQLDVEELEQRMDAADWYAAAALVLGEFLEGFGVPGATEFETWLAAEREEWRRRGTAALCHQAAALAAVARVDDAVQVAERALRLDPYSEAALLQTMKCLALQGNRADALSQCAAFAARLKDDLDASPGREVTELAARLTAARAPAASRERVAAIRIRRPPLCGRAGELSALLDSWNRSSANRHGEVALVFGDQGLGRSRLLEEMAARIELEGGISYTIRAVAGDRGEPLSGLVALSTGLAGAPGVAATPPEAVAALVRAVPEWAERFPVAGVPAAQWPLERAFAEAVRTAAAECRLSLFIDDAHWLDDASLDALQSVLRRGADVPVWIALGVGGGPGNDALDQFVSRVGRDVPGVAVRLGPLGSEAIVELVRWTFPSYAPHEVERLARRVFTDSAGIPLLAVELIHAIANGMEPGAAAWPAPLQTLDQSLPGDLPATLIAAFRVSFRRLSASAQSALAAAAVLGDRVPLARIAHVAELPAAAAEQAVDELEWARWLESEPRGYAFVARLAREVILQDMITPGQRHRLEAKAAKDGRLIGA
jgi:hypothetical protein